MPRIHQRELMYRTNDPGLRNDLQSLGDPRTVSNPIVDNTIVTLRDYYARLFNWNHPAGFATKSYCKKFLESAYESSQIDPLDLDSHECYFAFIGGDRREDSTSSPYYDYLTNNTRLKENTKSSALSVARAVFLDHFYHHCDEIRQYLLNHGCSPCPVTEVSVTRKNGLDITTIKQVRSSTQEFNDIQFQEFMQNLQTLRQQQ